MGLSSRESIIKQCVAKMEPEHEAPIRPFTRHVEIFSLEHRSSGQGSEGTVGTPTKLREPSSTQVLVLSQLQVLRRDCYRLHSGILKGSSITECMRAKIHSFLLAETAKQHLLRETYRLTCTFADLYFAFGGRVQSKDYQSMVLGCLILAAKIKEAKFPTISFQAFSREQLMNYQKQVAVRLGYNLAPPTYHEHAERIATLWEFHALNYPAIRPRVGHIINGVSVAIRTFNEQLDCAYMGTFACHSVLSTLDFQIEEIVVNLFYINVRSIHTGLSSAVQLTQQEFNLVFYNSQDDFQTFFQVFLQQYYGGRNLLNASIGRYLKPFLKIQAAQGKWIIEGTEYALQLMRKYDQFQSAPQGNYAFVKTFISASKAANSSGKGGSGHGKQMNTPIL